MAETIEQTVALEKISATESELKQLVADYGNYVVTESNLKEADEVRLKLYRPRIDIQRAEKANKVIIDKLYDENKNRASSLIKLIQPTEIAIEGKIKAVKDAIAERERKVKEAEQKRVTAHQNNIAAINKIIQQGAVANHLSDIEILEKRLKDLSGLDYQEFAGEVTINCASALMVILQRKEFLDLKAKADAQQALELTTTSTLPVQNNEDGTPRKLTIAEIAQTREFVHNSKEYPESKATVTHTGDEYVLKADLNIADFIVYDYAGYKFAFDKTLPKDTIDAIKGSIMMHVDNLAF